MKANKMFGGKPGKAPGVPARPVGASQAGSMNTSRMLRDSGTSAAGRPTTVLNSSGGKSNNSKMVRDGHTSPFSRPNIPGKVDNRRVGQ